GGLAVRVAGIGAAANLDGVDAQRLQVVERFLERLAAEQHRKNANFHVSSQAARGYHDSTRGIRDSGLVGIRDQGFVETSIHVRDSAACSIAASTRWFFTPSSKSGDGGVPFAIDSSRSYTVWVNVCSYPMMWPGGHQAFIYGCSRSVTRIV